MSRYPVELTILGLEIHLYLIFFTGLHYSSFYHIGSRKLAWRADLQWYFLPGFFKNQEDVSPHEREYQFAFGKSAPQRIQKHLS